MKNKKAVIFLLITIILISVIFNCVTAAKYIETTKIVVGESDTLWNIAQNICRKNKSLNIYEVIKDIKELNNLDSSIIYPNDILLVYNY